MPEQQQYGARQRAAFGVFRTKCEIELPLGQFEPKTQNTSGVSPKYIPNFNFILQRFQIFTAQNCKNPQKTANRLQFTASELQKTAKITSFL
ncbi:MAG: hypothetical protein NC299_03375 [Lachnospiraceae bacterium]|nr:hypothetical protein [Lachnospiraceae bacterium]